MNVYLVKFGFAESDQTAAATVSSLVVVIVDKDQSVAVGHQTYYKQIMETTNKLDVIRTLLTIPQATPKQLTRYLSAAVVLWNPSGKRNTKSTC